MKKKINGGSTLSDLCCFLSRPRLWKTRRFLWKTLWKTLTPVVLWEKTVENLPFRRSKMSHRLTGGAGSKLNGHIKINKNSSRVAKNNRIYFNFGRAEKDFKK